MLRIRHEPPRRKYSADGTEGAGRDAMLVNALSAEIKSNCMPDPLTGLTIGAVAGVAAKQAQDFIAAVSGHAGESIGTILGTITKRRLDNAEAIGSRAYLTLLNIGVKA